jgi:hypothetical protein
MPIPKQPPSPWRMTILVIVLSVSILPYFLSWRQDSSAIQAQKNFLCQFSDAICAGDVAAAGRSLRQLDCWWTDPSSACWRDAKPGHCPPHVFDKADLHYWQNQLFCKNLAAEICRKAVNDDHRLRCLSEAIHRQVHTGSLPAGTLPEPKAIWFSQKGLCDQQAWLLCSLAYQEGFEPLIVYLCDPATGISHHTVCELHKNGRVWLADPLNHILLPDESTASLATQPERAARIWDGHPEVPPQLSCRQYWLPAEPQDYCPRQRALATELKQTFGVDFPRCGESPSVRLSRYPSQVAVEKWFVPFRLRSLYRGLGTGSF